MYRLLSLRNVSQNKLNVLSSRNNSLNSYELSIYRKSFNSSHDHFSKLENLNKGHFAVSSPPQQIQSVRYQSTTPNAELIRLIKKKRKRQKEFTELLQVTEASTKQTKTSIQKLKANQLSDFIISKSEKQLETVKQSLALTTTTPPQLSLEYNQYQLDSLENHESNGKIYDESPVLFLGRNVDAAKISQHRDKLRDIMESYLNFKVMSLNDEYICNASQPLELMSSVTEISPMAVVDNHFLEDDLEASVHEDIIEPIDHDLLNVAHLKDTKKSNFKTGKTSLNNSYKSKFHLTPELERQAKDHSFNSNLLSYIEICTNNGMVARGFSVLQSYRFKGRKTTSTKITDVKLYNLLLHGYAEKGNLSKTREIMNILREDKITPTPQTFAAVFECIGRLEDCPEHDALLKRYFGEATEKGITLNDIIDKSKFVADQREMVLDAIRKIDPSFVPVYTPPTITYSNKLLTTLNEDVKPIESNVKASMEQCEIMNPKRGFSVNELHALGQEQLKNELNGTVVVKSIEKFPEPTETVFYYRKKLSELQDLWHSQICAAFNRDLNTVRHQTNSKYNRSINLYPYLRALDVGQYAEILLREVRTLAEGSETFSQTIGQLYRELGQKAQMKYFMDTKKRNGTLEKTGEIFGLYCEQLASCDRGDNPRQAWQRLIHEHRDDGPSMDVNEKAWPMSAVMGVGRFLYNILMRDIKIDVNIIRVNSKTQNLMPAFYTLFRNQGRVVKEEVKPHPVLSRLYRQSQQQTLVFDVNLVPMLCPPQPWSTPVNGGYLVSKSDLIRLPQQAIQQLTRINDAPASELYPALDSLNQLGSIPWKVNTPLLDVALEIFNNGGDDKLDVPQPPSSLPPIQIPEDRESMTKQEKFQIFRQKLCHRRKQAEMYSLWCDALYRLSLANHFRDKVFWLPHNMDFRGRVYPLPPHLNHLGSDLARSLLVFNQAQPLGPDGFDWLKLHCINLTGMKKRDSVVERLLYAEEIMDDIIDSADNPLTGRKWWTKSDEPWQTLGCCMEIAKVLRSEDPENYMSSFPIHQDGSCNGLQHYAALGRDSAGAISVNLSPSQVPQDVYSSVAALVEDTRVKDAENGVEVARILNGFVRRKVIKQTVMTTVYGVTRFGARLQIARQLKDIDNFPKEWVWPASTYLTTKTFDSLREMFTSTKEIQDWFTECARQISAICGQNVEWITPLGLPVVQPYNRFEKKISKALRGNEMVSTDLYEKPNIMKQKNAFPPNFIHSLDSSHMMLTSLHCEKAGLTFISVHDCFWTHARTVPEMNRICREQFVALHSEPILEDLSAFLVNKYSYSDKELLDDGSIKDMSKRKLNRVLSQLPEKGDFDLRNVLESTYFFS